MRIGLGQPGEREKPPVWNFEEMPILIAGCAHGESQRLAAKSRKTSICRGQADEDGRFPAKFTQRLQFVCLTALICEWFRAA